MPDGDSDEALRAHAARNTTTLYHPVGTCAMDSVVDAELRVLGVEGLRVVDASVMPVVPRGNRRRIVFHFNIRRDSAVLHFPFALQTVDGHAWRGNETSVQQRRIAINAHQSAPGARADQRSNLVLLEHPRQRIATRPGHFVDDHRFRTVDLRQRRAERFAFPRNRAVSQRALQHVDDIVRHFAAMVVALVDDRASLANLRKVEPVEIEVTADRRVGNVHVGEFSSA